MAKVGKAKKQQRENASGKNGIAALVRMKLAGVSPRFPERRRVDRCRRSNSMGFVLLREFADRMSRHCVASGERELRYNH